MSAVEVEPIIFDREHYVRVRVTNRVGPTETLIVDPAVALALADLPDDLRRAAEPPLVCTSCRDRNASHGDHCSVCLPDPLDYPKDAA